MVIEQESDRGAAPPSVSAFEVDVVHTDDGFRIIPPPATQRVAVRIELNETRGHRFTEYHEGDELRAAWRGEIVFAAAPTDEAMLDHIFRLFYIEHPAGYTDRSLSVADVVTLADVRRYAVLPVGFKRLADAPAEGTRPWTD